MDISLVTVNYHSLEPLLACLASLPAASRGLSVEIVVVDNAPEAGAETRLRERHPEIHVINNDENVGYSRAVNQGIAATSGEFVLVLNPDCEFRADAITHMAAYLRAHAQAAIVGPRILNPDGSLEYSARSFPDHLTFLFNRYSLLTRLFPDNPWSKRYLLTDWDHASTRSVDWLSGACMLVRRSAIERVGPMDEAFFMFNEDVDWCRRMKLAGWDNVYVPNAVIVHHIGASRKRVASRVIYERHRGMIHYFAKHHPSNPLVALLARTVIMLRAGLMIAANAVRPR